MNTQFLLADLKRFLENIHKGTPDCQEVAFYLQQARHAFNETPRRTEKQELLAIIRELEEIDALCSTNGKQPKDDDDVVLGV